MTLWPHQEQADEEMWEAYRRRTARPGSLPPLQQETDTRQRAQRGGEDESTASSSSQDTAAQRRGRISGNPQSVKDA